MYVPEGDYLLSFLRALDTLPFFVYTSRHCITFSVPTLDKQVQQGPQNLQALF